jgi:ABC-type nitrate/sulfonate/bicarbonate transport system substrate-binding protein
MLAANGLMLDKDIARDNTELVPLGGSEALAALKAGEVDAALFVGGASARVQDALRDPSSW